MIGGGDILMVAETGCLPVLQITLETLKDVHAGKKKGATGSSSARF
jgi:hypothetical protein